MRKKRSRSLSRDTLQAYLVVESGEVQRRAADDMIEKMQNHIDTLENLVDFEASEQGLFLDFFTDAHPELITEFVEFVYRRTEAQISRTKTRFDKKELKELAKSAVAYFHDEHVDLSTLSVTGDDFEPWPE